MTAHKIREKMNTRKAQLYHVTSISWNETWSGEIINNAAMQKSEYIEVPIDLKGREVFKFIDQKLYESTKVIPWYYNLDIVC
tara:strand:- start:677 stop:922 length:246 start_codon:yes stop_codon:yes gene_type:complete